MDKIQRIREHLKQGEAALVTTEVSRRYLTGFYSSDGFVVVTGEDAVFIVDFRYIEAARERVSSMRVELQDRIYDQLNGLFKKQGITSVEIEKDVTVGGMRVFADKLEAEIKADGWLSDRLRSMRMIKTADELALIQRAQDIADDAFSYIIGYIQAGMTEREVALELEWQMRKNGAQKTSFDTICIAGKKTSMPHGEPDGNIIKKGDFLTMDFGAVYEGYCSDMTRTVAIGEVSDEQKYIYATVLAAQLAALDAAKAGIKGSELDSVARDIIYAEGFEGCFGHGLGHSVGLEIHESPRASQSDDTVLCENMIMTIEPGIYVAGFGGVRIEDMIAVKDGGSLNFAHSPKELLVL